MAIALLIVTTFVEEAGPPSWAAFAATHAGGSALIPGVDACR